MRLTATIESASKTAAALLTVGVALLYLLGYLTLRVRLNVLGIPGDVNAFDDRYLYAGAAFVVSSVLVLYRLLAIGLRVALIAGVLVALIAWMTRRWWTNRLPSLGRLKRRSPLLGSAFGLAVVLSSILSVGLAEPWWSDRNIILQATPSPQADIIASDEWMFVYMQWYLPAFVSTLLMIGTIRACRHRLLTAAASVAFVIQLLALVMLFGALSADVFTPRIVTPEGQSGWLVWEDDSSVSYLLDESPLELIRRQRADVGTLKIVEYGRILQRRWRSGSTPGATGGRQ